MKNVKIVITCALAVFYCTSCAPHQPKQDPAVAILGTQNEMAKSVRVSDDAIKRLDQSIEQAEKHLNKAKGLPE